MTRKARNSCSRSAYNWRKANYSDDQSLKFKRNRGYYPRDLNISRASFFSAFQRNAFRNVSRIAAGEHSTSFQESTDINKAGKEKASDSRSQGNYNNGPMRCALIIHSPFDAHLRCYNIQFIVAIVSEHNNKLDYLTLIVNDSQ